jgi:hypothetical protein
MNGGADGSGAPLTLARVKFRSRLFMVGQHRLHVLEHGVKVVAIDGGVVVAVLFRKAMREIATAAGVHELALPAFFAEMDRGLARGLPARLAPDLIDRSSRSESNGSGYC